MRAIQDARALGASLRAARRSAGLTQQALAEKSGVSRRTLLSIEQGRSGEISRVLAVIRALGLRLRLEEAPPATFSLDILDETTEDL